MTLKKVATLNYFLSAGEVGIAPPFTKGGIGYPCWQAIVEEVGTILQGEKRYVYIPSFTSILA